MQKLKNFKFLFEDKDLEANFTKLINKYLKELIRIKVPQGFYFTVSKREAEKINDIDTKDLLTSFRLNIDHFYLFMETAEVEAFFKVFIDKEDSSFTEVLEKIKIVNIEFNKFRNEKFDYQNNLELNYNLESNIYELNDDKSI